MLGEQEEAVTLSSPWAETLQQSESGLSPEPISRWGAAQSLPGLHAMSRAVKSGRHLTVCRLTQSWEALPPFPDQELRLFCIRHFHNNLCIYYMKESNLNQSTALSQHFFLILWYRTLTHWYACPSVQIS